MVKTLLPFVVLPLFAGCAMVQNSTGSEEFNKTLRESFGKTTNSDTQGVVPMVGANKTYYIRSGGDVSITPSSQDSADTENIIKSLKAEVIEAQSKLKTVTKSSEDIRATMESSESMHKKWHVVSGVAVLLMALAALAGVFAISRLRGEISKWGFDPATIGRTATSLFNTVKEGLLDVNEELNYVNRKVAENGISADTKAELLRQRDTLKNAKARYENASNAVHNRPM